MFDITKFKNIQPKYTRYEKQLRRIQKKYTTGCIEKAVEGAVQNIKQGQARSFVIYGEPQSGKTEMMICLTAKLIDEGHKIIILLLNDNVELLNQNFRRFCYSGIDPAPKNYDQILDPNIKIGDGPWIIFCKKNSRNLRDLIDKIGTKKEKVIIDDEADYATPDANVNKKDKKATAINHYVGTLLDQNAIYIGVTATPARLDLNNTYENDNQKWIHFPPHAAYTGQEDFFPLDLDNRKFVLNFLPEEGDDPRYLREALFSFMVNVGHLNTIDDGDERNFSMLVHTSGRTVEHEEDYKNIVKVMQVLNDPGSKTFESYVKKLWDIAHERYPEEVDDIIEYVLHNKGKITPIVMNNKSKDDYEPAINPATPFTVAIGGNIISRGMTFNNLLSMFFTRDVKHKIQQDTYIQRARMFGSRDDVLNYFELHIPQKLYEDWHRCFIFHRLSWEAIDKGGSPVWLADRRISPAAAASIKRAIVSIDNGEISFDLFDYTPKIKKIWQSDLAPFDKLIALKSEVPNAVPPYLISFIQKFSDYATSIFIHAALDISNQKETDVSNIIRKKGLFGGRDISDHSDFNHHCRIFCNNQGKARFVYRHAGRVSFLKIKKYD